MARMTMYDKLSECYKLDPSCVGNAVQKLGELEDAVESIERIFDTIDSDDKCNLHDMFLEVRSILKL